MRRAVVLVLAAAALSGCAPDDVEAARPGDCLVALGDGLKTGSDFRRADCAAPDAAYRVAKRLTGWNSSCGSVTYGYISRSFRRAQGFRVCLTLNARVGDCFHQEVGFPTGKAAKVPCGASATYQVKRIIDGVSDSQACGPDAVNPVRNDLARKVVLAYPDPPHTVCTDAVRLAAKG